ncbi:hypothetical protein DFH06DRAFT_1370050 [Mycena polygramma]|nr:hypothetical protein DFH06DRAFT_1370050 [Mycena polygramma]
MSTHSVLSLELVLEILDSLAVPLHSHPRSCDLSALAACSAVCKGWSSHAQRLLFRRVILPANIYRESHLRGTTRNVLLSFLAAIDPATEHGRWLAESVVSLTMRQAGRGLSSKSTWLATALLRTPNLRHLDVTTIFFNPDTLAELREFGSSITSLCILQDLIQRPPPMHDIIASFPSIRILELVGCFRPVLTPFNPPLNLSLVSFKVNTTAWSPDIGLYLDSLINPNAEEACRLQVLAHRSDFSLGDALITHATHLRSLTVKTITSAEAVRLAACTRLERFGIRCFPDAQTLALIPRSITVLAVSSMPSSTSDVDALVHALETFPCLKTLAWSSHPPIFQPFSVLVPACQKLGIELRLSEKEMVSVGSVRSPFRRLSQIDDDAIELELRRKYIQI